MSLPHTVDDLEEDDELANSDIREAYKQNSNNARAFMVLRFRHFATFAVIMAFVSTGVFQFEEIAGYEQFAIGFGILMTLLFWNLDYRTSEYLKAHIKIAVAIDKEYFRREKRLKGISIATPKAQWLSATATTNLIFTSILVGWCGFMWLVSQSDIDAPAGPVAAIEGADQDDTGGTQDNAGETVDDTGGTVEDTGVSGDAQP